jgi:plasmid stability protein
MIQIRNVPEPLHREMKARAARAGKSLSEHLLTLIAEVAETPDRAELFSRLRERKPVYPSTPVADAVRSEREAR